MANEVKIKVTVDDKGASFDGVRKEAKKFETESKDTGKRAGLSLGSGIESVMGGIAKNSGSLLATMGPLAAPLIGASIGAAVVGGAAGVGIIGGIMIASKDARVQEAGKNLGAKLTQGLQKDAGSFVTPMLKSIDTIGSRFEQLRPKIRSIFDNSSKFLEPLTDGLTKGVSGVVSGIATAVSRATPVVDALSYSFANLGEDAGQFFADVSKGAAGAGEAIRDVTDTVGGLLGVLGPVIGTLGQVYDALNKIGLTTAIMEQLAGPVGSLAKVFQDTQADAEGFNGELERSAETGRRMGQGTFEAADGVQAVSDAAVVAADQLGMMANALEIATNDSLSLYDSNIKAADAIDRVKEAAKKNGKTMDINTEKGRENASAISALAKSLKRQYEAAVEVNGEGPKTDAIANRNRGTFIRLAESMGMSAGRAKKLANEILGIPAKKTATVYAATNNASARAAALRKQLEGIPDQVVNITVRTNYVSRGNKVQNQLERNSGFAHGGIKGSANGATASGLTWVGENGPELAELGAGSRVWSAGDSARKAAQSMQSSAKHDFMNRANGGAEIIVRAHHNASRDLINELIRMLRFEIGIQGGNVQNALGRN